MKLFNKSDLILTAALLSAALVISLMWSLFNRNAALAATIIIDGSVAEIIEIEDSSIFSLPERPNVVFEIRNGTIAFVSSDCPDKICIKTGFIRHGGQFAACLPNGVVLRITGKSSDLDSVAS
jgi:hypothetical protein